MYQSFTNLVSIVVLHRLSPRQMLLPMPFSGQWFHIFETDMFKSPMNCSFTNVILNSSVMLLRLVSISFKAMSMVIWSCSTVVARGASDREQCTRSFISFQRLSHLVTVLWLQFTIFAILFESRHVAYLFLERKTIS